MDVRIAPTNGSNVALEMADIDGIESDLREIRPKKISTPIPRSVRRPGANDGHEKSDIGLSQTITDEVGLALQQSLSTVECFKKLHDGILIRLGGLRKARLVHPIYERSNQIRKTR
jgi:hypothetical protein